MGWGIEGYIELNPDWKENREAIAAEAAAEEAEVTEAAGGVWPGVAGDPREGMAVLLSWCLVFPPPLPPPAPLAEESAPFGVNPARPPPLPPAAEVAVVVASPCDEVPWRSVTPPLAALEDEPALLCELPLSRFWFRSFSSRLHLALRLENQTCIKKINPHKRFFRTISSNTQFF